MKRTVLPILVTIEHPDDDEPEGLWHGVDPVLTARAEYLWKWRIVSYDYGEPDPVHLDFPVLGDGR